MRITGLWKLWTEGGWRLKLWKSRARWSKKKVARLGSGSRCWSRFSSRLVYLGSFPQGVTAIAQRRGESAPVVQVVPTLSPPREHPQRFSDIFRTRRNFYTGSAQPPTTELPFGTLKLSKNWSRFSFSVCVVTCGNFQTTASVDFALFAWHNATAMWHAAGFECRNRVVKLFDETS